MEIKMKMLGIKTKSGADAELMFRMDLIMLNTPDVCAQWSPDCVGVTVYNFGSHVKVGFTSLQNNNYQSFYFESGSYEFICNFFRGLRFPERCFMDLSTQMDSENE